TNALTVRGVEIELLTPAPVDPHPDAVPTRRDLHIECLPQSHGPDGRSVDDELVGADSVSPWVRDPRDGDRDAHRAEPTATAVKASARSESNRQPELGRLS